MNLNRFFHSLSLSLSLLLTPCFTFIMQKRSLPRCSFFLHLGSLCVDSISRSSYMRAGSCTLLDFSLFYGGASVYSRFSADNRVRPPFLFAFHRTLWFPQRSFIDSNSTASRFFQQPPTAIVFIFPSTTGLFVASTGYLRNADLDDLVSIRRNINDSLPSSIEVIIQPSDRNLNQNDRSFLVFHHESHAYAMN